jgi:hypothetical protein
MRLIAFAAAAWVVSGPAAGQSWEEYSYPEYAFSVSFPANPNIEMTSYEVADGRLVPARVYSARQDKGQFKMMVVDLANTRLDEKAVIDHAVKTLSQGATVKINVPARIYQVSAHHRGGGRQPLDGRDVRHHGAALSNRGQRASRWE